MLKIILLNTSDVMNQYYSYVLFETFLDYTQIISFFLNQNNYSLDIFEYIQTEEINNYYFSYDMNSTLSEYSQIILKIH